MERLVITIHVFFVNFMKNYKAEVEKIRENHVRWIRGAKTRVLNIYEFEEAIKSLFREIAKEATYINPEYADKDVAPWTVEKAKAFNKGFLQARSEILSNIEKVI